jgi:uncharacterized coiled-coil protein SlyX
LPGAQAVNPPPGGGYAGGNTAEGQSALLSLTSGIYNTGVGVYSLLSLTDGKFDTGVGAATLLANTADQNTAIGAGALFSSTTGSENTATGAFALFNSTTGNGNIALGAGAGINLTTGDNNIDVGNGGVADESATIRIGDLAVRLKPVTYRYKKNIDPTQSTAFGLIAEEVAEINSDLVACNAGGQPESVHYEMVNAMLLNEFLKEHKIVQEQQATIAELRSTVAQERKDFEACAMKQQKQIQALTVGLQKASAQLAGASPSSARLETSKAAEGRIRHGRLATRVALNNL